MKHELHNNPELKIMKRERKISLIIERGCFTKCSTPTPCRCMSIVQNLFSFVPRWIKSIIIFVDFIMPFQFFFLLFCSKKVYQRQQYYLSADNSLGFIRAVPVVEGMAKGILLSMKRVLIHHQERSLNSRNSVSFDTNESILIIG